MECQTPSQTNQESNTMGNYYQNITQHMQDKLTLWKLIKMLWFPLYQSNTWRLCQGRTLLQLQSKQVQLVWSQAIVEWGAIRLLWEHSNWMITRDAMQTPASTTYSSMKEPQRGTSLAAHTLYLHELVQYFKLKTFQGVFTLTLFLSGSWQLYIPHSPDNEDASSCL